MHPIFLVRGYFPSWFCRMKSFGRMPNCFVKHLANHDMLLKPVR